MRKSEINDLTARYIYNLKALAIISVIFAHCPYGGSSEYIKCLYNNIGTFGVPIFFFLSGILYNTSKYSFRELVLKKLKTIVIPWIFCGTVVYFYVGFRKGGIGFFSWMQFIIGDGSYLYFMTMLVICMLIYYWINKSNACKVLIAISLLNYLVQYIVGYEFVNQYINPLNWIGYFGIGVYIRKYKDINSFFENITNKKTVYLLSMIVMLSITVIIKINITYWHAMYLIYEIILFCGVTSLSSMINNKYMYMVGKYSFTIYLTHMPFVGLTNILEQILSENRYISNMVFIFRPIIVVLLTMVFIKLYFEIARKMNSVFMKTILGGR